MSMDWTPEELTAVNTAMKAVGYSYEDLCEKQILILHHIGRDSWDRPVYECDGRLYVDVDPRMSRQPNICTKLNNEFDGEPCDPVQDGTIFGFVPERDTWPF